MSAKKSTTQKASTFRTPIVAVMGHVDHGKTTLLDTIRGSRVAAKEEGGITQNTRAHQVTLKTGNKITFIDTPGHEAFSAMRARGAEVTDIVLLVVAADDGVQNQTKQSINFAKETNTPIIVAINKIDVEGVKLDKIKRSLSDFGVIIEEYGGDVMAFEVSATKNKGIEDLLEGIELLAEVQGLSATTPEHNAMAQAYVLESTKDRHLGAVSLGISKGGVLSKPVFAAAKNQVFKVRAYLDQDQKPTQVVNESDPFWVSGLNEPLDTGAMMYFFNSEDEAKTYAENYSAAEESQTQAQPVDLNQLLLQKILLKKAAEEGIERKTLNIIVKSSTKGTLEAVLHEISKLSDDEKGIEILNSAAGEITESDIRMAKNAGGIVISFQQKPSSKIESLAKQEKVIIRNYEIIYEMLDELDAVLDSLIAPELEEVEVARARVKQTFTLSNGDVVAGCEVVNGNMLKGYQVYIERPSLSTKDDIAEIGRGKIGSLRILKEEVKEAKKGQECGIIISPKPQDLREGDEIVAFKLDK